MPSRRREKNTWSVRTGRTEESLPECFASMSDSGFPVSSFLSVSSLSHLSLKRKIDKKLGNNAHQSGGVMPRRPNVNSEVEETKRMAKETYREARASKRNPVAKNMNTVNKPATHRDRKNDYQRKDKHTRKECRG